MIFQKDKLLILGFLSFFTGSIEAHIVLKPDKVMQVPVKCGGLTRIKIQEDKVQDVVVYPSKLKHRVTLHDSGQVYVSLKDEHKGLQLSLMTRRGVTQDLVLICDASKSEVPLIFEHKEEKIVKKEPSQEEMLILSLSKRALEGGLENSRRFEEETRRYTPEGLVWEGKKYWEVGSYRINFFEAKNKTKKIILLKTDEVRQQGDCVVSFDQEILEPDKKAVLVVVTKENAQKMSNVKGEKNDTQNK